VYIDGIAIDKQTPYADRRAAGETLIAVRRIGYEVREVVIKDSLGREQRTPANGRTEFTITIPHQGEVQVKFVLQKR
jgi:hypothetical protein